jgi:hypothetical protein
MGKLLGMQHIEVGGPEFYEGFIIKSRLANSRHADDLSACGSFFAKPDLRQWPSMFRRQSLGT